MHSSEIISEWQLNYMSYKIFAKICICMLGYAIQICSLNFCSHNLVYLSATLKFILLKSHILYVLVLV